jgi:hypothetical protein
VKKGVKGKRDSDGLMMISENAMIRNGCKLEENIGGMTRK